MLFPRLVHALKGLALSLLPRNTTVDIAFARTVAISLPVLLGGSPATAAAKTAMLEAHGSASWLAQVFLPGLAGAQPDSQVGAVL